MERAAFGMPCGAGKKRNMKDDVFVSKIPIEKGWSGDRKYCATDGEGNRYLLRLSPLAQYERKKSEHLLMARVANLGIPMCRPLSFGISDGEVYSVQTWIDGVDAEESIPRLDAERQYSYGCEAGRILKRIHEIPAPEAGEEWESYFNRKMDRKIKMYRDCPIKPENGEAFVKYIEENRHLLHGRPRTFQHGDYHIGNMMVDRQGNLVVIDFNRWDFGDPWEEFNRIVWCAAPAPVFATGMVDGYFDGSVPMEFWRLLALYVCSNTLSSVPWAIPFGEGEIQTMLAQARDVLCWYDGMQNPIPTWYLPPR